MKFSVIVLGIGIILIFVIAALIIPPLMKASPNAKNETISNSTINYRTFTLNFVGVSGDQKAAWLNGLNQVKDYWFANVKSITIYGKGSYLVDVMHCTPYTEGLAGCNDKNGNIGYSSENFDRMSTDDLRKIICHELAHTYISGLQWSYGYNTEERIVSDIGNSEACLS